MRKIYLFSILVIGLLSSCTKEKEETPLITIDEFLKQNASTTGLYTQIIEKAQLASFKDGPGPFTWVIPNDAALNAARINQDSINRMTSGAASYFVMYNLFNGAFSSFDIVGKNSFARNSLLGTSAFLGAKDNSFFVNGSKISNLDNQLKNGFAHITDRVNTPPQLVGTVQTVLGSFNNGADTLFQLALRRTGLLAQMSSTAAITVLVPTNTAMINAGYTLAVLTGTLTPAQLTTLGNILRYHYFPGIRYFSNDFQNGLSPFTALSSRTLMVSNNGAAIRGTNNTAPVNFVTFDRLAMNGVVHTIDNLLRP